MVLALWAAPQLEGRMACRPTALVPRLGMVIRETVTLRFRSTNLVRLDAGRALVTIAYEDSVSGDRLLALPKRTAILKPRFVPSITLTLLLLHRPIPHGENHNKLTPHPSSISTLGLGDPIPDIRTIDSMVLHHLRIRLRVPTLIRRLSSSSHTWVCPRSPI